MTFVWLSTNHIKHLLHVCVVASAVTRFEEITPAAQHACVCPGDVLTYECIIAGSGTTVWTGSGFTNCPSQGNQILLLHSMLMEGTILERKCDGGSIIAEGTEITGTNCGNGCYSSRLNVTVNHNTTVVCIYDASNGTRNEIGNSTIRMSGKSILGYFIKDIVSSSGE